MRPLSMPGLIFACLALAPPIARAEPDPTPPAAQGLRFALIKPWVWYELIAEHSGKALEVPVGYFYDGLSATPESRHTLGERAEGGEILARKETLDLIRAYYQLGERPRRRLLDLAKSLHTEIEAA